MSEHQDRDAIMREIAKKKAVYSIAGMEALPVRRGLAYHPAASGLLMDVYYPSLPAGQRAPAVIIPLGYPDPQSGVRMFGPVTSWAQLIAASGMAAVIYGTNAPAEDAHAALTYVRTNGRQLDLDEQRLAILSSSGSVPVALSVLMKDRAFACAVLNQGCTFDMDGSTAMTDMSRQVGFVDACAGKSVDDLPDAMPMLFVRAGRDQSPGLNEALDKVVTRALARNLPLTLVNHASGLHGFECDEDSDISRHIIRQILAFLAFHLKSEPM